MNCRLFMAMLCLALVASATAHAEDRVRMSWETFAQDQNRVRALIRGVAEMKRRNAAPKDSAQYRTSWEYWSAMHGYLGATGKSGTVAEATAQTGPLFAGLYTGITDMAPPASPAGLGQEVWDQCTHTFVDDQNVEHRARHFLSWHRMYLYFFERVLRAASGDPNLTLPYWDYTNESQLAGPVLFFVSELPTAAGDVPNPLFEPRRTPGLGVLTGVLPRITDPDDVLALSDFEEFQVQLEQGIHGGIHCAVGNGCIGPIMGLVSTSAGDPIFWIHHANIDRLWDCWTTRYGESHNLVNDTDWMNQSFVFVDETGARATMQVKELFGANKRTDYRYEKVTDCSRRPLPPPEQSFAVRQAFAAVAPARVVEVRNVNVTTQEASVSLPMPQTGSRANAFRSAALEGGPRLASAELVLEGIDTASAPGVLFEVGLSVKGRAQTESIGFINFFGQGGGPNAHHAARQTRRFNVTTAVRRLQAQGVTGDWVVTFSATSGLTGVTAGFVGERFQASRPDVRIQRIELRVRDAGSRAALPAILRDAN